MSNQESKGKQELSDKELQKAAGGADFQPETDSNEAVDANAEFEFWEDAQGDEHRRRKQINPLPPTPDAPSLTE